jgi:OmpA-OmpF porin, OOP family
MKNFIISLLIFTICAFLGMWWFYTCEICQTNYQEKKQKIEEKINFQETTTQKKNIVKEVNKTVISKPEKFLNIKDEKGSIIYAFDSQLQIFKSTDSIYIPNSLFKVKDSLLNYLNKNQNKELLIYGWHNNEQMSNSNLGIERANYLKDILTKFGLNTDKISIASIQKEYAYNNELTYNGGIELVLKDLSEEKASLINKGIISKSLYTKFNSRKFIPDNTLMTYTYDLKNYLLNHPDKKVSILGHTDSVGDEMDNKVISRDRATNVMKHFINNGIDKNKLQVFSKGETEPIADNATKEGRAKNRRIEINVN